MSGPSAVQPVFVLARDSSRVPDFEVRKEKRNKVKKESDRKENK
jgi:hypothetical protein